MEENKTKSNKLYEELSLDQMGSTYSKQTYTNVDGGEMNDGDFDTFNEVSRTGQYVLLIKNRISGNMEFLFGNMGTVLKFPVEVKEIAKNGKNVKQYSVKVYDDLNIVIGDEIEMKDFSIFMMELTYALSRDLFDSPKKYYEKMEIAKLDFNQYVPVKFIGFEDIIGVDMKTLLNSGYTVFARNKDTNEADDTTELAIFVNSIDNQYVYKILMQVGADGNAICYLGNGYFDFVLLEVGNVLKGLRDGFENNLKLVLSVIENMTKEADTIEAPKASVNAMQRPPQLANLTNIQNTQEEVQPS